MPPEPSIVPDPSTEFITLLTQHDRSLTLYVYGLVSQQADADDILQQTKMVMWRCFSQFESGTNFIAWARKIAFHQILGYRRQHKRAHLPLSEEMLEQVGHEIARLSDQGNERRDALRQCVQKLPDEHRQIIRLRYDEELEVDQIAEKIDRTTGAVYRALSRLRYHLLECVERQMKPESNRS